MYRYPVQLVEAAMPGTVVLEKLNTAAAARIAGVGEGTIRAWARAGALPVEQTPLGMLIARDDLEDFLQARERQWEQRLKVRQVRVHGGTD